MTELTWEEPPRGWMYPRAARGKHTEVAGRLKERPGEWAKIPFSGTSQSARSMAYTIREARMKAYEPAGAFEAVSRTVDGETCVWARYVGEKTDE